jgi:response regulator NasT
MTRSLRIVVADDERDMREYFQELLTRLGHQPFVAENGRQLADQCRAVRPDLIITDIKMPGPDGIAAAAEVNRDRPVPVILVSGHHDAELLARAASGHVMAYLIKPVKQADVEAAIGMALLHFEQFQAVRKEADTLRQALEDRKVIERAKGAVMRRVGVDEEEAFRRLRKLSSNRNHKLVEVAQMVLGAEEVFQALEKT